MAYGTIRKARGLLALLVLTTFFTAVSSNLDESKLLVQFKNSLSNASTALSDWSESTDPCGGTPWTGLRCVNGNVLAVQLENMGLTGTMDMEPLSGLSYLRSLSLANNSFNGPMPVINKLVQLKSLYLSGNGFSGKIPDGAFDGMVALRQVFLQHNQFTDEVPNSLVELPRLVDLSLEDNHFKGRIPDFLQMELEEVNLANNQLEGPIPKSLSDMPSTFFIGNKDLCGKPLAPCKPHKNLRFLLSP